MPATALVREMYSRDTADCAAIEVASYKYFDLDFEREVLPMHAWTKQDIEKVMLEPGTRAHLIQEGENDLSVIVGYFIFDLQEDALLLRRLIVHPDYRRSGFGQMMLHRMWMKALYSRQRKTIKAYIREDDLKTCQFFAKMNFKPTLVRGHNTDGSDSYLYSYVVAEYLPGRGPGDDVREAGQGEWTE